MIVLKDGRVAAAGTLAELLAGPVGRGDWSPPDLTGTTIVAQPHCHHNAVMGYDADRGLLEAAGAQKAWAAPVGPQAVGAHLLGTCRMGDDPNTSVVDRYHRTHDVPNLFICDGSSMVTSGRGQPTMTIQALAFRAAEHIARFARQGEI